MGLKGNDAPGLAFLLRTGSMEHGIRAANVLKDAGQRRASALAHIFDGPQAAPRLVTGELHARQRALPCLAVD
jgi:hypothetical protein